VHKVIGVESNETAELARFVAAARSSRPRAWQYVERLKAVCALTSGTNPELRDLLRRIWRLEREVETLRQQTRVLMAASERVGGAAAGALQAKRTSAANSSDYDGSVESDARITP
jgi:hypothetical protein